MLQKSISFVFFVFQSNTMQLVVSVVFEFYEVRYEGCIFCFFCNVPGRPLELQTTVALYIFIWCCTFFVRFVLMDFFFVGSFETVCCAAMIFLTLP